MISSFHIGLDYGICSRVYNTHIMNKSEQLNFIRSGELAGLTGVSTDTLRHYEKLGLLPLPRRSQNGYREYPKNAIDRVHLVRSALFAGFTLGELSKILKVRDKGGIPCKQVRALASAKLVQIEKLLMEITAMRDRLRTILGEWDVKLQKTAENERAGLLEALVATNIFSEGNSSMPISSCLNRKNGGKKTR
jgi:MerR family transcriptional regulator, copper efflux regulator